jgi:hypothetical protein
MSYDQIAPLVGYRKGPTLGETIMVCSPMNDIDESSAYRHLVEQFLIDPSIGEGQMMGMPALKAQGKMFGGCFEGRLVVKIGRDRVQELVAAGHADLFDPSGRGRPMKDWASLSESYGDWLALAQEARELIDDPTGRV